MFIFLLQIIIKVFKIISGFDNISLNDYVTTDLTSTIRNNGFKIISKRFRSNESKHFFFDRTVNIQNVLLSQAINNIAIESFKKKLDKDLASVHHFEFSLMSGFFLVAITLDNSCVFTFLYKVHDSLFILHGIASSFSQFRPEGGLGG